jgi:hypothetical protein
LATPEKSRARSKRLCKRANTAYFVRGSFNAPRTDESAERLADASVAPSCSLLFLLAVLGALVLKNLSEDAPRAYFFNSKFGSASSMMMVLARLGL